MQGFGAVAVLNLAVMSGNVAGVRKRIFQSKLFLTHFEQRTKQVIASSFVFM
jgi:hypothetical protein